MSENKKNGGDDKLITKLKTLLQSSNKKEEFDKNRVAEINHGISKYKSRIYDTDLMYVEFSSKFERKKKYQKNLYL